MQDAFMSYSTSKTLKGGCFCFFFLFFPPPHPPFLSLFPFPVPLPFPSSLLSPSSFPIPSVSPSFLQVRFNWITWCKFKVYNMLF